MSMKVLEDGEANFWMLAPEKGNWCARIQFNGELQHEDQEELAQLFADKINEEYDDGES